MNTFFNRARRGEVWGSGVSPQQDGAACGRRGCHRNRGAILYDNPHPATHLNAKVITNMYQIVNTNKVNINKNKTKLNIRSGQFKRL